MNEKIKAQWIAALRDPEAKQITGKLGTVDGGRCCLGVLCDIAVADGVIPSPTEEDEDGVDGLLLVYGGRYSDLPGKVIDWAGLQESDPQLGKHLASAWNDDHEKTFFEIALLIEKYL